MSQIRNVKNYFYFTKTKTGRVLMPDEMKTTYPECSYPFQGVNFYYSVNKVNQGTFDATGNALNATHRTFFKGITQHLLESEITEATVVLGLEPPQISSPYPFVSDNLALVKRLAEELAEFQKLATGVDKNLRLFIRYASEMNVKPQGNKYAGDPTSYKDSFRMVRGIFQGVAPAIKFVFSPAIRADLMEGNLPDYWPGDSFVDVIGGTWYVGAPDQFKKAKIFFQSYLLHRQIKGKPFGIDEIGGTETVDAQKSIGKDNDKWLQKMLKESVYDLEDEGIVLDYATIFLEKKWGTDAKLGWLSAAPVVPEG